MQASSSKIARNPVALESPRTSSFFGTILPGEGFTGTEGDPLSGAEIAGKALGIG
jgi:hypothetical protein